MKIIHSVLLGVFGLAVGNVQAANLSTLYQETVSSFPGLKVSESQVAAGTARARQAQGSLLPQISASGSVNRTSYRAQSQSRINYNGKNYSLRLTQSVFDRVKTENKRVYEYLAKESQENLNALISVISVDLVDRYVTVLAAEDKLEEVKAEQELINRRLEALRSLYQRQLAVLTDVLDVEARLDGLKAQIISAKNDVAIAREGLTELVGREVNEALNPFSEILPLQAVKSKNKQYWINRALANNYTLRGLNQSISAAQADVRQAKAGHLPTIDFQLSAQRTNIGNSNAQSSDTKSYVAALNFSVPIYSGGTTSARSAEKHAQLVEARAKYEEERRSTVKRTREAYLNVAANFANIQASKKAIISAKKSYEAMEKGFKYGTVTVIDVLDSQKEVLRYSSEYKQNQYDYVVNWINLLSLSGELGEKSINVANSWLSTK